MRRLGSHSSSHCESFYHYSQHYLQLGHSETEAFELKSEGKGLEDFQQMGPEQGRLQRDPVAVIENFPRGRRSVPSSTTELCGKAFDAREREVEPQS